MARWLDTIPWEPERFSTPTIFDAAKKAQLSPQVIDGLSRVIVPDTGATRMIAGWASTIHAERREPRKRTPEEMQASVSQIAGAMKPNAIVVWSVTGDAHRASSFGGMVGKIMAHRKINAVVIDGLFRDVEELAELGFGVWAQGTTPASGSGAFEMSFDVPVTARGAAVKPNDLLFADASGIVVLPASTDLELLKQKAIEVETKERRFEETLRKTGDLDAAIASLTHI
jgi:regulator of RNase E activity RraA